MNKNLDHDAQIIKQALEKIIDERIEAKTRSCPRCYRATVKTAPNGTTIDVQLVGDDAVLTLPYSSKLSGAKIGDTVWVMTLFNSFRNAIVWETNSFV